MKRGIEFALAWCLLLASSTALSLSGAAIDGQVLDESTGMPVAGAIVVTTWNASDWSGVAVTRRVCYHVETATTDANGKFHIPAWSDGLSTRGLFMHDHVVAIEAYKAGFGRPNPSSDKQEIVRMAPFKGTKSEYFDALGRIASGNNCSGGGESRKNLYRLFVSLADELEQNAETREKLAQVEFFFARVENLRVNHAKPTTSDKYGLLKNVNPEDSYEREELLK